MDLRILLQFPYLNSFPIPLPEIPFSDSGLLALELQLYISRCVVKILMVDRAPEDCYVDSPKNIVDILLFVRIQAAQYQCTDNDV